MTPIVKEKKTIFLNNRKYILESKIYIFSYISKFRGYSFKIIDKFIRAINFYNYIITLNRIYKII